MLIILNTWILTFKTVSELPRVIAISCACVYLLTNQSGKYTRSISPLTNRTSQYVSAFSLSQVVMSQSFDRLNRRDILLEYSVSNLILFTRSIEWWKRLMTVYRATSSYLFDGSNGGDYSSEFTEWSRPFHSTDWVAEIGPRFIYDVYRVTPSLPLDESSSGDFFV